MENAAHPVKNTKRAIKDFLDSIYTFRSALFPTKKVLLSFLFHNIFSDASVINLNEAHPHQNLTVQQFRKFIEYFLEYGYSFISSDDIAKDNIVNQKNILVTFDDGYFSNLQVLPILNEYNIPAVIFVTANNIKESKLFWWDVLYRERSMRGTPEKKIFLEMQRLQRMQREESESYLIKEFGKRVFTQTSDLNRPLSISELRNLSQNKLITIGNHTCDHVNLPLCSDCEIKFQIENAQTIIAQITGIKPNIISYPYGCYNEKATQIARRVGLSLGFTVEQRWDFLPLNPKKQDVMKLGRFCFDGGPVFSVDFDVFRPEIAAYYQICSLKKRINSAFSYLPN